MRYMTISVQLLVGENITARNFVIQVNPSQYFQCKPRQKVKGYGKFKARTCS